MILLHRHADRQIVDDRDHLAEVPGQQAVEQHLIAVVQGGQINILIERIWKALILSVGGLT